MIIRKPAGSPRKKAGSQSRAEQEILNLVDKSDRVFSVSVFLDLVNEGLSTYRTKIRGEVSSAVERSGHWYFDLKDKDDGSVISCLIWRSNYRLAGVKLEPGLELIASGRPVIYKPNGRMSFQADAIELVGEGALRKQFDELKAKLQKEGLFSADRKKSLPIFPEKIGLITSRQGEAIHDFLTNLGRFGFHIDFIDSRVEGAQAVPDLVSAVESFRHRDIDVLVLVRGGGSLESLLSFNNEALVRAIAAFPKPVVTGIGHEQDVSLVDLAADRSCSTPTGTAKLLSYGWEQARARVDLADRQIRSNFRSELHKALRETDRLAGLMKTIFRALVEKFRGGSYRLKEELNRIGQQIKQTKLYLRDIVSRMKSEISKWIYLSSEQIVGLEKALAMSDPARLLKLGYGLPFFGGRLVRSVSQVAAGDEVKLQLSDGIINSEVKQVKHGKN